MRLIKNPWIGAEGEILVECTCTYFTFDAAHAPEGCLTAQQN